MTATVDAWATAVQAYKRRLRDVGGQFEQLAATIRYVNELCDHEGWPRIAEARGITAADIRSYSATEGGLWVRLWNHRWVLILPNPNYVAWHRMMGVWT